MVYRRSSLHFRQHTQRRVVVALGLLQENTLRYTENAETCLKKQTISIEKRIFSSSQNYIKSFTIAHVQRPMFNVSGN